MITNQQLRPLFEKLVGKRVYSPVYRKGTVKSITDSYLCIKYDGKEDMVTYPLILNSLRYIKVLNNEIQNEIDEIIKNN